MVFTYKYRRNEANESVLVWLFTPDDPDVLVPEMMECPEHATLDIPDKYVDTLLDMLQTYKRQRSHALDMRPAFAH